MYDAQGVKNAVKVGLRIDVDTYRGTRLGVPALCDILAAREIAASFFFSVGPDNMGRHLWRLLRPAFLRKMLRTRAGGLYGWDILLRGTIWPGPNIGDRLAAVIRRVAENHEHEIGLHAWDHHAWQAKVDRMSDTAIERHLTRAYQSIKRIVGRPPIASAVPGWRCHAGVLLAKERFDFAYNSDCRGERIFYPVVDGKRLTQVQIPVTLPTYDEAVGANGVDDDSYNDWLLAQLRPDRLNVLTIHAEVEGILHRPMFERFLDAAGAADVHFVPLGHLLEDAGPIGEGVLVSGAIPGREGAVALGS